MSCTVWGCTNNDPATADPSVHYYVFPKHPVIAQQWIEACGWPPDDIDLNLARICSVHFTEDSYNTEVKLVEYITCYTKVLKFDAVPTLYLPLTSEMVLKETDSQLELREMVLFTNVQPQEMGEETNNAQTSQMEDSEKYKHIQTKEQLSDLEKANKTLRERVQALEANHQKLTAVLAKQMEVYKARDLQLSHLHQEYLRSKRAFLSVQQQKALLSKVFSDSQIKILSGKKKIYWSNDDMAVGYTIRHLSSRRCYMYLSKKLNIPLPAVSSIKRWMTLKRANQRKELTEKAAKEAEDEESE